MSPREESPREERAKNARTLEFTRRQVLGLFGGTAAGAALGVFPNFLDVVGPNPPGMAHAQTADNPIVVENQQPGSAGWQLGAISGRAGYAIATDTQGQIKGYASSPGVNKGEQIKFHISVNPAQSYTIEVYRMGWYNGLGGRLLKSVGPLEGSTQPAPQVDATTGLAECKWSPTYTLSVPSTWTSGIYLALLTNSNKFQTYITFVVRDDARVADLLYQQPVTTYQAYNNYPNDNATGKSLYNYNSFGASVPATGAARAAKVSFDRPYNQGAGSGYFAGRSWSWERFFVRWLERSGYDVAYTTSLGTHGNGARLLKYKGFLTAGHDEYWSKNMYDAAVAARDAGVNLAFLGADSVDVQVRLEASTDTVPNRVMVCYKNATLDPVKGATATLRWRDPLLNRPEQTLVGVMLTGDLGGTVDTKYPPYVVKNSSHWVYNGTGLVEGDQIPGLAGYEVDRYRPEYPLPPNTEHTILSHSPVTKVDGTADYQNTSIYRAPSGAWVFGAGTCNWSFGLDKAGVVDARIQQITTNILNKFVETAAAPPPEEQQPPPEEQQPPPEEQQPPPVVQVPAAPSNLLAQLTGSQTKPQINLKWTDNASDETNFVVERSTNNVVWDVLTSALPANTTSYSDKTPARRTTYHYRVRASNEGGSSDYSNIASATTR